MTPDQVREHAAAIILDHARDVEFLSISEHLEDADLSRAEHNEACRAVDEAIRVATVTVEWPGDPDEMDEVDRLGAALRLCEHVLHRASPTDAMLHAAQQASSAHVTDWTVADVLDDLAPGSVLGTGVVDWAAVTWVDEDSQGGAR